MKKAPKPTVERSMVFDPPTPHPLVELIESEDLDKVPELTSIGMYKMPGSKYYTSFVMKSKGGQITKLTVEEPNIRQVAEESAKISFVNEFMNDA